MLKGKGEDTSAVMAEVAGIGDELKANEVALAEVQAKLAAFMEAIPNLPHASVPVGQDETGNVEVRKVGTPPAFDFEVKDHVDVGAPLGLDFDSGDQADRLALLRHEGRHRPPAPRAGPVHARHPHRPARLHRVLHPLHGQRRFAARHRPAAEVRSRPVLREKGRRGRRGRNLLPDPDLGSLADQPGARRDRRAGHPADQDDGAHPVLPLGSRQLRPRHPRHDPPAPVRQGRNGADGASRNLLRQPWKKWSATPKPS